MGIITAAQCESLEKGGDSWSKPADGLTEVFPLKKWVGRQLLENKRTFQRDDDLGYDFEEIDLEFEQLKELEAENCAQDDDEDFESLRGPALSLWDTYVGSSAPGVTEDAIRNWLDTNPNLYDIKARFRGSVYNYFRNRVKERIVKWFRGKADGYYKNVVDYKAGGWEQDQVLIRKKGIKIIGMTTTGLSKYRALVTALGPKIVLIEEAAETMEAPLISACVPTMEHLILVGDHKQLRPQCAVRALERHPFNLNVSLFERMVTLGNDIDYSMLKKQRRMIPEIRRLLKPIYDSSITDHESMKDLDVRPPVPGMGGVNSFFFTHYYPETTDEQMSSMNQMEADMVVGFFDHLVHNGITEKQITVLTFYNGQRKLLLRKLRQHRNLGNRTFKVVTVDSYQGEENDVVILSLVRSNDEGKIGFLGVENRICVALSRAKRGFYIFGNAELLVGESKFWAKVVTIMAGKGKHCERPACEPKCRVVFNVPTTCVAHGRNTFVSNPDDWDMLYGGCEMKCTATLSCGHLCPLNCHPFDHSRILCSEPCNIHLPCGHPCSSICGDPCKCQNCKCKFSNRAVHPTPNSDTQPNSDTPSGSQGSDVKTWKAYATDDVKKHDLALYQKKVELDLAAAAGQQRFELRDRFLEEQIEIISPNPALQVVYLSPLTNVESRLSLVATDIARSVDTSSHSANTVPSGQNEKVRHIFKGTFSLDKGPRAYPGFENKSTAKRTPTTRPVHNASVRYIPTENEPELLIDLS
jgi:helicase required for RNAi-mediated heterochromatin assembly 1